MDPNPQPPPEDRPRLVAGTAGAGGLDRAVREDLESIRAESLLARQDAVADLTKEIEQSIGAPLALSEITRAIDRLEGVSLPSFSELEQLVATPDTSRLTLEGNYLADLMEGGPQARAILKSGLLFLKHRRYAEAIEWWTLQRRDLDSKTNRLYLLLLIMEALTHLWAGDTERAAVVQAMVRAHPLSARFGPTGPTTPRGNSS
jgi:hypothetical protein